MGKRSGPHEQETRMAGRSACGMDFDGARYMTAEQIIARAESGEMPRKVRRSRSVRAVLKRSRA